MRVDDGSEKNAEYGIVVAEAQTYACRLFAFITKRRWRPHVVRLTCKRDRWPIEKTLASDCSWQVDNNNEWKIRTVRYAWMVNKKIVSASRISNQTRHLKKIITKIGEGKNRREPTNSSHQSVCAEIAPSVLNTAQTSQSRGLDESHAIMREEFPISGRGFLGLPQSGLSTHVFFRSPVPIHHVEALWSVGSRTKRTLPINLDGSQQLITHDCDK